MKSIILSTLLFFTTFPAFSESFYNKEVGNWVVFGDVGGEDQDPACVVSYEWRDGSEFQLIYELYKRELWIWFENFEWDIRDPEGYYKLDMVIVGNGNNLNSGEMDYYLTDKNTIYLPNIEPKSFIDAFAGLNELRFIMPGNIPNAYLSLDGSRAATEHLIDCVDVGNSTDFSKKKPIEHNL